VEGHYRGDSCWAGLTAPAAETTSRAGCTLRHVAPYRQLPAKKCEHTRPESAQQHNHNSTFISNFYQHMQYKLQFMYTTVTCSVQLIVTTILHSSWQSSSMTCYDLCSFQNITYCTSPLTSTNTWLFRYFGFTFTGCKWRDSTTRNTNSKIIKWWKFAAWHDSKVLLLHLYI